MRSKNHSAKLFPYALARCSLNNTAKLGMGESKMHSARPFGGKKSSLAPGPFLKPRSELAIRWLERLSCRKDRVEGVATRGDLQKNGLRISSSQLPRIDVVLWEKREKGRKSKEKPHVRVDPIQRRCEAQARDMHLWIHRCLAQVSTPSTREFVLTSCSSDSNVGRPVFEFNVAFLNIPSFQGSSKQLIRPAPSMLSIL